MRSKRSANSAIRLRGVRQNNLKNFDLDLPVGRLIVVTGPSGSGKSSLAFDTLYAEGQRRYIETFSPYARQFFDRMDKPRVDRIEGIPPAIAIEQRNTVKTTRSTVGTITEICDYMKLVWSHSAQLYCRRCGQAVRKDSPEMIWRSLDVLLEPEGGARLQSSPDFVASHDTRARLESHLTRESVDGPHPRGNRSKAAQDSVHSIALPSEGQGAGLVLRDQLPSKYAATLGAKGRVKTDVLIAFEIDLSEKLSLSESLALISKQGYQRLLLASSPSTAASDGTAPEIIRVEEAALRLQDAAPKRLTVLQDRLVVSPSNRARFVDGCEQAYHFGRGKLIVYPLDGTPPRRFSNRYHCAECDLEYREPTAALFSFNHPLGACPVCRGFGRTITIDYDLAIPDPSLSLAGGAVRPWQSGQSAECQQDLLRFCKLRRVPIHTPFRDLAKEWQDWVLNGDPGYGKDKNHEWPNAWYGVKGYFRWLESRSYRMHVRVLLSRYRAYRTCPECSGQRLQPEALLFKLPDPQGRLVTLSHFYQLPVSEALRFVENLAARQAARKKSDPLAVSLNEVRARLRYLEEVGLGYLTLDRATRTLSGGETERVSLTTCLGSGLVNTLFVLDEPSVGLHARDTARLVRILQRLRDAENTVVVVEHDASVMRAADHIVDLGPGHGETGGQVVFQGTFASILRSQRGLTGQYLSGRKRIEMPRRRKVLAGQRKLILSSATLHNLKDLNVEIPLERFVCITGVSGSGKSTLVRGVLLPSLEARLRRREGESEMSRRVISNQWSVISRQPPEDGGETGRTGEAQPESLTLTTDHCSLITGLTGAEHLGRVVLVDQSPIGKTPRSTPAVYGGAFDFIRELFGKSEAACQRGLKASAFSFNSNQGQCERCRGAGFEKVEMQFLSDVYIRCPDCAGRRYRSHILEVKLQAWSIADVLEATVEDGVRWLSALPRSRATREAVARLRLLEEVGLGYLRLGQPINTLSGGECQRLKLVSHLAGFADAHTPDLQPTLFLFDEPTTGLHFEDIAVLLRVFQRLVDAGHSVLIIEHNLDVIKCADWVIDLGPEAGEGGGRIVAQGTPETIAASRASYTGRALLEQTEVQPHDEASVDSLKCQSVKAKEL
ncbi:MAG: excinuclease ABC subunit UvrA [Verrucomicrobia bacterium]|nr:excinuclease ABC subunit UvrA [Verrucomicrobiota bacterium]